jgi:hypothetical protein
MVYVIEDKEDKDEKDEDRPSTQKIWKDTIKEIGKWLKKLFKALMKIGKWIAEFSMKLGEALWKMMDNMFGDKIGDK